MDTHCRKRKVIVRQGFRRIGALAALLALLFLPGKSPAKTDFDEDPEAIEKAAQSVVYLEIDEGVSSGSGFVLFDGQTLVTNYHVIEEAHTWTVMDENCLCYEFPEVLIASRQLDIAILHAPEPTGLQPLTPGTDEPMRGEKVVAIGSPEGFIGTVSLGNVSNSFIVNGAYRILFTAPISPGSSGGALFDRNGRVIGVTSGEYYFGDGNDLYQAAHISEVLSLYEQWDGHTVYAAADHEKACIDRVVDDPEPKERPSAAPETPAPVPVSKGTRVPLFTPEPGATPTPRVSRHANGELVLAPGYARTQQLTLTPPEKYDCYLYLARVGASADGNVTASLLPGQNGEKRDIAFYLTAGGPPVKVKVPPGRYKAYPVMGKTFYGSSLLFGNGSQYYILTNKYAPHKGEPVVYDIGGPGANISLKTEGAGTVLFTGIDPAAFPGR